MTVSDTGDIKQGETGHVPRNGPLSHLRVLDFTHARAGPSCARVFADWGADVIHVLQPPREEMDEVVGKRYGFDYQNLHRNKRSLTLDLKSENAKPIIRELVKNADVILENLRPGVTRRLGIDYETVSAINPRIVYGSISGFGQEGPYSPLPSLDQIAQGMSGLMSVTGLPGSGPGRIGVAITDVVSGAYLAQAVLIGLVDRERTGRGTWVHTSLLETGIALLDFQATRWLIKGEVPGQEGNFHPTVTPTGLYETLDGFINISAAGSRIFSKFCLAVERPDMNTDRKFASSEARAENRTELNSTVSTLLKQKTTSEWMERFTKFGVPCGPVYSIPQVFDDPHVKFLEIVQDVHHDTLGDLSLVAQPFQISGYDRTLRSPTPEVGQDTDAILKDLGIGDDERRRLRLERTI